MSLHQVFNLGGLELVPFSRLGEKQRQQVLAMRNAPQVARWMGTGGDISPEDHQAFMDRQHAEQRNFNYLACDALGDVGVVSLHRVDTRNELAWLGIYRNPFRSERGLGMRLLRSIGLVAFGPAGLNSLKLEVVEDNVAALALYRRFGFRQEGRYREAVLREDRRLDLVIMGLLAREFSDEQV
jgi:UDP-4-amino-4,6-dideoxy-N-acetyl-beta-L-altrosamine N-acetyltransferase